jgi:hypothetical protein
MDQPPESSGLMHYDLAQVAKGYSSPTPTMFGGSDGRKFLYPATMHWISGEPGSGKSFLACAAIMDVVRQGGRAVVLDYEDSAATLASRLISLGAEDTQLKAVLYFQVFGRIGEAGASWLAQLVSDEGVQLVVVDSASESLSAEGCDENSSGDVTRWVSYLLRPLTRAGAAVVVLDHVVKAKEGGGRWARGSGAKLAVVDGAAFVILPQVPFSRGQSGHAELRVAKDRQGSIGGSGDLVGLVRFQVANGSVISVFIDAVGTPVEAP